jgi:hypothetical protein
VSYVFAMPLAQAFGLVTNEPSRCMVSHLRSEHGCSIPVEANITNLIRLSNSSQERNGVCLERKNAGSIGCV